MKIPEKGDKFIVKNPGGVTRVGSRTRGFALFEDGMVLTVRSARPTYGVASSITLTFDEIVIPTDDWHWVTRWNTKEPCWRARKEEMMTGREILVPFPNVLPMKPVEI